MPSFTTAHCLCTILVLLLASLGQVQASPYVPRSSMHSLERRTDPYFPASPSSCPICEQNYPSISSCAQAAPVLANFTEVIFNPGAFIDVIKCACTDTFQSAFPQCVDCFEQTNQTDVLATPDLPSVVKGVRNVCAVASSILGGVASSQSQAAASETAPGPPPAPTSAAASSLKICAGAMVTWLLAGLSVSVLL